MPVDVSSPAPGTYAAVTGASGAVGPHLAAALAARGWPVALVAGPSEGSGESARDAVLALAPDARLGYSGIDLRDESAARRQFEAFEGAVGACSVLLNAVGGFAAGPAATVDAGFVAGLVELNLLTVVNATRAVLPGMLARGQGFVLAFGAGAASSAAPGRTAYAAAKAAVAAYMRSLAAELAGTGVHAAVVHPMGTIDTPANRAAMPDADTSRWIPVSRLVEAALYLAANPGVRELEVHGGAG